MFTGIIEELGEVVAIETLDDSARLTFRGPLVTEGSNHGDSIAVNGVCLTVVAAEDGTFTADVMRETLDRSSLGSLVAGSPVNLERPTPLGGRLSGHLVQGHVDGAGVVVERAPSANWDLVTISLPAALSRYVAEKGSIAVDGVSLTVVSVGADHFTVGLIPTTLALTTLGRAQPGTPVNLEVDVVAKYVERLLTAGDRPPAPFSTAPDGALPDGAGPGGVPLPRRDPEGDRT